MLSEPRPNRSVRRGPANREHGFTLLEVLVAFAIAALARSVLFQGALAGLRSAGVAGRYEEALSRARSHLAALGDSLVPMDTQGEDGGTSSDEHDSHPDSSYHWHVRVSPLTSTVRGGDVIGGLPATRTTLYHVSVAVSWQDGSSTRTVELDSERLGTTGPGPGGP